MILNKLAFCEETQTVFPTSVGIDMINSCNLGCNHHLIQLQSVLRKFPTLDQLRTLRDELHEARLTRVCLTGYEPMMQSSFQSALELFLDRALRSELAAYTDHLSLQVTLDGLGLVHERVRGVERQPNGRPSRQDIGQLNETRKNCRA